MSKKSQFQVAVVNEIDLSKTGVTIAAGETTSTVLDCGGTAPSGIIFPENWTECNVAFSVSKTPDGPFYVLANFDGSLFAIAANEVACVPLQPSMFNSVLYLKITCDTAQTDAVSVDFNLFPYGQGIHN